MAVGYSNSIPKYMTWRHNDVFEALTLYGDSGPAANLGSGDRPNEVKTARVSKEYFQVFGVAPLMGRVFNDAEDLPNGPPAAVIGYNLWQTRLGGDPRKLWGAPSCSTNSPIRWSACCPRAFSPNPPASRSGRRSRPTLTAPTKATTSPSPAALSQASLWNRRAPK